MASSLPALPGGALWLTWPTSLDRARSRRAVIEATRILAQHPDLAVVLLSTYQAADLPADAATSGAVACVNIEEFGPDVLEELWARRAAGRTTGRGPARGRS